MVANIVNTSYLTTDQYEEQQMQALTEEDALGRDAFLKLLTTQLTNQNPLDPMDNEAFVAQLAQFSSVEGIKGMQTSLEQMVSGMRQDQMLTGANLVGKSVAIEGGRFVGGNGMTSTASVDLPQGAQSIILSVHDLNSGELVYRETGGAQMPGEYEFSWRGTNEEGQPVALGNYVMTASIVRSGKLEPAAVTTMNRVRTVSWDPETQEISLEVDSGEYITLAEVKQIGG